MAGRPIIIEWDDAEYVIPENEVFEVGEAVEEILPLAELGEKREKVNTHKLARAMSVVFEHAGASISPADVRRKMMDPRDGEGIFVQSVMGALSAVLMDGMPDEMADDDSAGSKKKTGGSSKPATKSRSKSSTSRRRSSGE